MTFKQFIAEKDLSLETKLIVKDWLKDGEVENPTDEEQKVYDQLRKLSKKLAKDYGVEVDWSNGDDVEDFYTFKFNSILDKAGGINWILKNIK